MTDVALPRALPRPHVAQNLALAAMLLAALVPTLPVDIPALADYPNHLGRMSVLTRAGTPAESLYYQVNWLFAPNLAMDLLIPPLAKLIGVPLACKLFYHAAQILVLTGVLGLTRAVQGNALLAGGIACLYFYATPFAFGFINFEFALGFALWGMAFWIGGAEKPPARRLAIHALFCGALFVAHLFGLAVYGFVIGGYELWRLRQARSGARAWLRTGLGMALPVLALTLLMRLGGGTVGGNDNVWHWANKLPQLVQANGFSTAVSFAITAAVITLGMAAARCGTLKLGGAGPTIAAVLAVAYLATPFQLFDTAYVDIRVAVAAALTLPAFMTFQAKQAEHRLRLAAALVALVIANGAFTTWMQFSLARDYDAVIAALEKTTPHPRIMIARTGEEEDPPRDLMEHPMYHAAMLAVHTRDGLVPTLFAYPGKQPLLPRPHFRDLTIPQGGPVPLVAALHFASRDGSGVSFIDRWTEKFDYLLLLKPEGNPLPARLEQVAADRRFALFRVKPPG